jgi:DNA-binding response OmpR family regulator
MKTNSGVPAVLLLAENDEAMRSLLCDEFLDMGLRIVEAATADQALQYALERTPDVILTDLRIAKGGIDYVSSLRKSAPNVPIVLMNAFGDAETKTAALALGVAAYFNKPVRISDLKLKVKELVSSFGGAGWGTSSTLIDGRALKA